MVPSFAFLRHRCRRACKWRSQFALVCEKSAVICYDLLVNLGYIICLMMHIGGLFAGRRCTGFAGGQCEDGDDLLHQSVLCQHGRVSQRPQIRKQGAPHFLLLVQLPPPAICRTFWFQVLASYPLFLVLFCLVYTSKLCPIAVPLLICIPTWRPLLPSQV